MKDPNGKFNLQHKKSPDFHSVRISGFLQATPLWLSVTDVSKDHNISIFRAKQSKNSTCNVWHWMLSRKRDGTGNC